jgi:hypothetical protein
MAFTLKDIEFNALRAKASKVGLIVSQRVRLPKPQMSTKYVAATLSFLLLAYYVRAMEFGVLELLFFIVGSIALWLPLGALFFVLLKAEIPDYTVRFTLSALASYCLTTLLYFTLSVWHVSPLFYIAQVTIVAILTINLLRKGHISRPRKDPVDWVLVLIILGSIVSTNPYKKLFDVSFNPQTKESVHTYRLFYDHLAHASTDYELDRHTPNEQASYRAGTPDRAYHNFPHITTVLLARFSRQSDMLRAHIVYHYTIIEILFCLALFSIVFSFTSSKLAGYVGAASLYILLIRTPPLLTSFTTFNAPMPSIHWIYFTIFPHASSGMELVEVTSSQMYCGLLVLQGILLSIVYVSKNAAGGQRSYALLCLSALMIASTVRFRANIFVVVLPSFVLIMLYATYWQRSSHYIAAAGLALLVSALLLIEMRSSRYLPSSSTLRIALNDLAAPNNGLHFNNWPFAYDVIGWIRALFPNNDGLFRATQQIVSMFLFSILNIVGPLLTLCTIVFLTTRRAWGEFRLISIVFILSILGTVFCGTMLAADYDSISLGGQVPFHLRWYLLALGPVALWPLFLRAQERLMWPREYWMAAGAVLAIVFLFGRYITLPSKEAAANSANLAISEGQWLALNYLHDQTPQDSVVIMRDARSWSGIYGRAAYYENIGGEVANNLALRLNPEDNRPHIVERLWSTDSTDDFCSLLSKTGASYLLDDIISPLHVENPPCLTRIWSSPRDDMKIFKHNVG